MIWIALQTRSITTLALFSFCFELVELLNWYTSRFQNLGASHRKITASNVSFQFTLRGRRESFFDRTNGIGPDVDRDGEKIFSVRHFARGFNNPLVMLTLRPAYDSAGSQNVIP